MATIDLDALAEPSATPVQHCGKPMRWKRSGSTWEGKPGEGFSQVVSEWACNCGASLITNVRVPS